jgi:hypothetical protein
MTSRLPDQWTIRLLYPRPPAGLSLNDRPHFMTKARNTATVRHEVFTKVRAAKVPALERVAVDVTWIVFDARKRDSDNPAPLLKAIYDGIGANRGISARIVEDDSPEFMDKRGLTIMRGPGKGTAFFEIRITDLGDAT